MDVVIYSKAKSEDFRSYYRRLESLLADESATSNTLKPLKVSRKSVTVRSASRSKRVLQTDKKPCKEKKLSYA